MKAVEIAVAVLLCALGALVVVDSIRLGAKWADDGPQSGYFPFYIGLIVCIASVVNLLQAVFEKPGRHLNLFVERGPFKQVLTVLLPAVLYVLGVQFLGIYVASAIYICVFMVRLGKYAWLRGALVGVGMMIAVFVMFEIWFKVPLVKGLYNPLGFLGY